MCHLAGKHIRKLRNDQPELNITTEEILIVEIAGLCHDLGNVCVCVWCVCVCGCLCVCVCVVCSVILNICYFDPYRCKCGLHETGHGPFSHLWDQRFQTEVPNRHYMEHSVTIFCSKLF